MAEESLLAAVSGSDHHGIKIELTLLYEPHLIYEKLAEFDAVDVVPIA